MDNTDIVNIPNNGYNALKEEYENQKVYIAKLEAQVAELEQRVNWFIEQTKKLKNREYGQSSEKSEYDLYCQASLFNEAERFADPKIPEPEITTIVKEHKRRTRLTTDKLPPDLPVEIIEHTLPDEEQVCPNCGDELHCI